MELETVQHGTTGRGAVNGPVSHSEHDEEQGKGVSDRHGHPSKALRLSDGIGGSIDTDDG